MPTHNPDIAQALDDVADFLELQNANPFRVRAYRNASRVIRGLGTEVSVMLQRGDDLAELPGIGDDLAEKIATLAKSGHLPLLDRLRKDIPAVATELLKLPGLGPKRVRVLCEELDLHNVEQLHRALLDGRVRALPGFGAASETKLLHAVEARSKAPARLKLALAEGYVEPLLDWLRGAAGIDQLIVAGSYRRCRETVGDIDILATAPKGEPVVARFTAYEEVGRVMAAGSTRATVALKSGLQVDLRVVLPESYGAALHYFTGSKAHNIAIRRIGQKRGLKINEYGVFRGQKRIAGRTEKEVYGAVDLPYIEPELRENRGEIEAAAAGTLPHLIELADLRGDLHAHTNATDGHETLAEMAEAARALGLEYLAITDHSRHLAMTHGLDPRRLMRQDEAIDRINAEKSGITLLKGIEVDILEDGALDLPDEVLGHLDFVTGAVHSQFGLSRAKQTERILRALEHPHFTVLAHPTGRLIEEREPYDVDMPRIIRAAKERGCFLELNAHPDRLDLTDIHCRLAKEEGVLLSIGTDSHRAQDLANLRFGVAQARRGWLEKNDVLNTRSLKALRPLLARTMR
ncbi:MAG: DNA polymerase/3'-5' exonuclease PolX [Parvibaculum sedimenti]|uniref:DNA polymerase/3'-5' exonuclease PolX n=1 Tax=Parvibaculum sedimenti TaxID=2608632 RepID=UPI003BB6E33A